MRAERAGASERVRSLREEDTHFAASMVGEVIGTPAFMAPEQTQSEEINNSLFFIEIAQ